MVSFSLLLPLEERRGELEVSRGGGGRGGLTLKKKTRIYVSFLWWGGGLNIFVFVCFFPTYPEKGDGGFIGVWRWGSYNVFGVWGWVFVYDPLGGGGYDDGFWGDVDSSANGKQREWDFFFFFKMRVN